jgi:DnaA-homolog protein
MSQIPLSLGEPPAPTLANFVAGENKNAVQSLLDLTQGNYSNRFIYLWGISGSGCSHLLQACADWASCFDDCQSLNDEQQHDAFVQFTQALTEPTRCLIFAGDRPPHQLNLRDDLQSRLTQCLVFEVKPLSEQDLRLALALTIAERGIQASPDLIDYLTNRLPRNMGKLRAALDALDRLSLERKKPLNIALAREFLGGDW